MTRARGEARCAGPLQALSSALVRGARAALKRPAVCSPSLETACLFQYAGYFKLLCGKVVLDVQ